MRERERDSEKGGEKCYFITNEQNNVCLCQLYWGLAE